MDSTVDRSGATVRMGQRVRVVGLQMSLFEFLEPGEIEDIRSMIGAVFPVERISADGYVTVTKTFNRGPGLCESHSLSLMQGQFEAVDGA